ncbi:HD-GYP domain-containing protein [Desulfovibrio inopinatus]|uniref:HD-GYP domain-containing protein n=1 Tax=Desulfovibrio inopinatus TaxID=102109 RepID=UPI00048804AE|nr:HD domain-containing phosphohydrolase [Desulfovibrio inopinatus]
MVARDSLLGRQDRFIAVSPLLLSPKGFGTFKVYIKQGSRYVLYATENERFTSKHRQALFDRGIDTIYVEADQVRDFYAYREKYLGRILNDESLPLEERNKVMIDTSMDIMETVFCNSMPIGLDGAAFSRVTHFAEESLTLLKKKDSLKYIKSLLSHDYKSFSHSVQVFVYTTTVLSNMGLPDDLILQTSIGSLLHDIGKVAIDPAILQKPGPLTKPERRQIETHPIKGVGLCANQHLSTAAMQCILAHHERMCGGGYPSGVKGEDIPLHVRAVTIADIYDALTTNRVYAEALSPYEALKVMRDEIRDRLDNHIFRAFVLMLSGAKIV